MRRQSPVGSLQAPPLVLYRSASPAAKGAGVMGLSRVEQNSSDAVPSVRLTVTPLVLTRSRSALVFGQLVGLPGRGARFLFLGPQGTRGTTTPRSRRVATLSPCESASHMTLLPLSSSKARARPYCSAAALAAEIPSARSATCLSLSRAGSERARSIRWRLAAGQELM